MNPLLSIIIPVYNAEKYLRESLNSVVRQGRWEEYELMLINDGSRDTSLDVLWEYERKYPNIRVIDKPNEGVSATRNRGIAEARGEYVYFMDADDLLSPSFFDIIMPRLKEGGLDILAWSYKAFYRTPKCEPINEKIKGAVLENTPTQNEAFNQLMKVGAAVSPWTKAIRRQLLRGIGFDKEMTYGEDFFFSWKAILMAKRLEYLDHPLYHYRQTGESAVSKFHPNLYENYRRGFDGMAMFMEENHIASGTLSKDIDYHFACRLPALIRMESRAPYGKEQRLRRLRMILDDPRISRALTSDPRLSDPIFDMARNGELKRLLRKAKVDDLKSRLLLPLKRLLK